MRASPRATLAVNASLALAATVVALALLEAGLRVIGVESAAHHAIAGFTVHDPDLGWRLAPARETMFRGAHFAVHVTQNAEGLRDRHYDETREPGRARVLVLGDSFVWCWGVEQADCFTERLERTLADADVINAGVPGWSTAQAMLYYERDGRRYRPDVVLLVMVANDFTDNLDARGPRFRLDGTVLVPTNLPVRRRQSQVGEWLQERSRLYAQVRYWLDVAGAQLRSVLRQRRESAPAPPRRVVSSGGPRGTLPVSPADAVPPPGEEWPLMAALLDRLIADVRGDGARIGVVLEVMPRRTRRWLQAVLAERGVPVLDLGPALTGADRRGIRTRLAGDPHLAAAGQEVVAEQLRGFLEQEAFLPRGGVYRAP